METIILISDIEGAKHYIMYTLSTARKFQGFMTGLGFTCKCIVRNNRFNVFIR